MSERYQKISRMYRVVNLMWRAQLHHVAEIDAKITEVTHAQTQAILYAQINIPPELIRSRLYSLQKERSNLLNRKTIEYARAQATGLKLKRIERLLFRIDDPT